MEKIKSNIDHKDYMRMAMLKHEETFREQVYELHRLYRMQKVLMQSVATTTQQKQETVVVSNNINKGFTIDYNQQSGGNMSNFTGYKSSDSNNITMLGLQRSSQNDQVLIKSDPITESKANVNLVLDESEIELTLSLGPSTRDPRRRKSNSGHESLSSSSTGSSQTRKTSPKSNTTSRLARNDHQLTWGSSSNFPQGSDLDLKPEPGFSNGQSNSSPWLFQALSLKST